MPRISIYLPGCFFLFFCHSIFAAVLSCKAADGKTIFTDDPRKCSKQQVTEVPLNIPRQTRVNYRYPHRLGGEGGGARYIHHKIEQYSLHDNHWNNAVVIYSADSFLYHNDIVTNHLIVHELAHAWHFLEWTYQYQPIIDTWLNSRNNGLYQSVKDYAGRNLNPAYATTNEYEYFADLSAIFFVGGTYHPFDKQGLAKYDPKGYSMIEAYWLTQKTNLPQK